MGGLDNDIGVYGRCGECNQIVHALSSASFVYCSGCGTTNPLNSLKNARESSVCEKLLQHSLDMSKSLELVAFRGVHNFEAKLLSPFLSRYGMDRDGAPKLLREMNMGDTFDCALLANRHFRIRDKQKAIPGSGKDKTVYQTGYLDDTLTVVAEANRVPEALIAAHADPDGHCLVHAISRAISGTQLFWHPLRMSIKEHLQSNLLQYRRLMVNYVEDSEWPVIIDEADPCYLSGGATLGLRNIHVFALANVLRRPIILLDSQNGMGSVGDYSAIFLPVLAGPSKCRDKSNRPHPPIAIAWASPGRNHFIPILPKHYSNDQHIILPMTVLPPVWLVSQDDLQDYVTFKSTPSGTKGIQLGGGIEFSDGYLVKLIGAMRRAFSAEEKVQTFMITKLFRDVYRETDCTPANITANYKKAMGESRLFICHNCGSIGEVDSSDLKPLGDSYELVKEQQGYLQDNKTYQLPNNMTGIYVAEHDQLQLVFENSHPECLFCGTPTTSVKHKTMSLLDLKRRSASNVQRPAGKTLPNSESINKKQKAIEEQTKSDVAGKSGNLRIKICLSDGRSDVMQFSSDVNTSTFLSLISQKFDVPVSTLAQIRSGHPPKLMDKTKSNSPVEFSNGDRVQVTLRSSPVSSPVPTPSSGTRITEPLASSMYTNSIPESVKDFWKEAQNKDKTFFNALLDDIGTGKFTSLFKENGGYAQLTRNIKRAPLEEGQHYNLMNFQDVVFCWEDGAFKVCLGPEKHKEINDGYLYTVTANDLKKNCMNLSRIPTSDIGPGISRISGTGSATHVIDKTEELARRLANRKN
ncbi:Oidioi.mRNA.OKI2018_I69.PAR.g13214.t1.cds [Oikopleura dioica]|uniref:Oidioi.mRNA.OKI2018_I69.PAR.g13214.t1.cds n=1 Tax=Oikopleura dioica TaxID=34765 RepID=A0ABN7SBP0_OIKDI|nr:Oidioi.mRNA.OKI2018_I69.PAR.g13214.t1.cds [Oikopleura dioica]